MYSVKIRQHILIAHSLQSETFGAAQRLHGATFVVDAKFSAPELDEHNTIINIDMATNVLKEVLHPLNYQNLDELEQFRGKLTTAEFLANYIHRAIHKSIAGKFQGKLKVTLGESHVTWASYEGEIAG